MVLGAAAEVSVPLIVTVALATWAAATAHAARQHWTGRRTGQLAVAAVIVLVVSTSAVAVLLQQIIKNEPPGLQATRQLNPAIVPGALFALPIPALPAGAPPPSPSPTPSPSASPPPSASPTPTRTRTVTPTPTPTPTPTRTRTATHPVGTQGPLAAAGHGNGHSRSDTYRGSGAGGPPTEKRTALLVALLLPLALVVFILLRVGWVAWRRRVMRRRLIHGAAAVAGAWLWVRGWRVATRDSLPLSASPDVTAADDAGRA